MQIIKLVTVYVTGILCVPKFPCGRKINEACRYANSSTQPFVGLVGSDSSSAHGRVFGCTVLSQWPRLLVLYLSTFPAKWAKCWEGVDDKICGSSLTTTRSYLLIGWDLKKMSINTKHRSIQFMFRGLEYNDLYSTYKHWIFNTHWWKNELWQDKQRDSCCDLDLNCPPNIQLNTCHCNAPFIST